MRSVQTEKRRATGQTAARIAGPAPGGVALLIVDMINPLDFPGAEALQPKAETAARAILALRRQADRLKIPVIYVNDNYGQWHSEKSKIIAACGGADRPGRALVRLMRPRARDYFIIKPQVSGFFATNLEVLLAKLEVRRLVITGMAADICVLFTAADAHMRGYGLWTPQDTVTSETDERGRWALEIMRNAMQADTVATAEQTLAAWRRG